VNAGLAALEEPPPEYLLLRAQPEAWTPEDTLAVNLAMKLVLEDAYGEAEAQRALPWKLLPDSAFAFFGARDSGLDAPIDGTELPLPGLPRAEEFSWNARSNRVAAAGRPPRDWATEIGVPGSNSWAVDRQGTNVAIPANDMHLALGVPGIWFRARIRISGPRGRDVTGFTLPGTPAIVVGSNRHIA
jgi:penicillin amidase